ncbi:MAG TPA: alpha/beta fold hydrolase [Steroidobacteraceae bacterium]|nr:alpha/beta fold hydrolase [Steroidobacteraceae bacterium]
MNEAPPIVLIPGLLASARLYAPQLAPLWCVGPVTIANHTHADTLSALARRILDGAPPRFALAGLSMGGYIAFEILRQAPERVVKLALLDTSARADTAEQSAARRAQVELATNGRLAEVVETQFQRSVHRDHRADARLREVCERMAAEVGAEAFVRQQRAISGRPDSRPFLKDIRCPVLVLVGDGDELTPPPLAQEIAAGISGAQLVTVAHSGHLSTLEQPQTVTAALLAWLAA